MNAFSPAAGRAALMFACALCVVVGATLPRSAPAASVIAASPAPASLSAPSRDAPVALQVDALMFDARRMRDALVGGDNDGYASAHGDFSRIWRELRDSPGLDPAKLDVLDSALTLATLTRNSESDAHLQRAAQDVVASAGAPAGRAQ